METEKTRLQKIMEQKAEQIRKAIEQAIDEGAKIENKGTYLKTSGYCTIDGVFLQFNGANSTFSIVLNSSSDKIAKIFEPSKDDLKKMAEQKRAELEDIEKQLKERGEA